MLKETAIPSTRSRQNILLFQGAALLSVSIIMMLFCFKFITFTSYSSSLSRVPKYNGGILIFPFFFFLLLYSLKYLLNNKIYHFQLHPNILIITSRTAFSKKRDFFHLEEIHSILIEKEQKYKTGSSSIIEYVTTVLSIKSTDKGLIKYAFSPNYHELKDLKELLKDFI